jgi:MoaA/NifB/PqqE/SkfB family radical SAM enzyme
MVIKRLKEKSKRKAINKIFNLLIKTSDKNLIRATKIAEFLTDNQDIKGMIRQLRLYFEQKHPCVELGKRVLKGLNKNCLEKLVNNFFINAGIIGITKHREFEEKEGFPAPWFLVLSPTMRCNLSCTGCSTREFDFRTDLNFEILDRILTEAKEKMGIYFIVTQGGEMFIRKDMFDLYKKHNDIYFQVYTNGTLIDKENTERLVEVGNVAPILSVEGFETETDQRRGKGVWKKVMQAMDSLREAGIPFGFSVTMTRYNTEVITSNEFIDFMISKGCLIGWYFQYIPIGKNPDFSLMAKPEQRDYLRRRVMEIRNSKQIFIGDFWNDGPYVKGCIAGGRRYVHINHRGEVEPCAFVHFAVDNVREKSLTEVLKQPFYSEMRKRVQAVGSPLSYSDNLLTPCMIIDQPWVLREMVEKYHAQATDGGDSLLKGEIARRLDEYSRRIHKIYDPIWENEYKEFKDVYKAEHKKLVEKFYNQN